jgi:hypothetical protein
LSLITFSLVDQLGSIPQQGLNVLFIWSVHAFVSV